MSISKQSRMLPSFKSTNMLDTTIAKSKGRLLRDRSTISNYLTPQKDTIDTKSLVDTNLPEISSKRQQMKRSSYLQMWLDEALDPQQKISSNQSKVEKTGPLMTVRKFELDRKYLKTQNISEDTIAKLYNSLYVYTHGIDNLFKEMLALTKNQQYTQKKLLQSFWKAFITLLEGCSSFRTSFQLIEQSYVKQIGELKESFLRKEIVYQEQKKSLEEEIHKMNKIIMQSGNQLSKLASDFKITESTLQLTDNAFNEQVLLRLKFQEKINRMFNSYQELKLKYETLLHNIQVKNQDQVLNMSKISELKMQQQKTIIHLNEKQRQLLRAQAIIKQKDESINIKRQENIDLTRQLKTIQQNQELHQIRLQSITAKADSFKMKYEQGIAEISAKELIIKELQHRIFQMQKQVNEIRKNNQIIYEQYEESGQKLKQLKSELIKAHADAKDAIQQANLAISQANELRLDNQLLIEKLVVVEHNLKITGDQLAIKSQNVQKNKELIASLHAAKNKYENICNIAVKQKDSVESIMCQTISLKCQISQEMEGIKMLLKSKQEEIMQLNDKLATQREIFRKRIYDLKNQIQQKQSQILGHYNLRVQQRQFIQTAKKQANKDQIQIEALKQIKSNLQIEISQINVRCKNAENERIKLQQNMKQLNQKLEEIAKNNMDMQNSISKKEWLLKDLQVKKHEQNQHLRVLLQEYRQQNKGKVGKIHPMLYQDVLMQIDRATHKIHNLQQNLQAIVQANNQSQKLKDDQIASLSESKKSLQEAFSLSQQSNRSLEADNTRFQTLLNQKIIQIQKLGLQLHVLSQKAESQQTKLSLEVKQNVQKMKQMKNDLNKENKKNLQLSIQMKKLNQSFAKAKDQYNQEIQRYRQEIQKFKQEIQELSKNQKLGKPQRKNSNVPPSRQSEVPKSRQSDMPQSRQSQIPKSRQSDKLQSQSRGTHQEFRKICVDTGIQTDKKFSHANKFEVQEEEKAQIGCQTGVQHQKVSEIGNSTVQPRENRKIDYQDFRKALKMTYMRP